MAFGDSLDVVADPVVAADPRTAVQLPSDVVGTPVALADGVVLAATADGSVYGIRDGALRWRVVPELVGARVSTALTAVAEGALVSSSTGGDESETSFVDPEGTVRWRAPRVAARGQRGARHGEGRGADHGHVDERPRPEHRHAAVDRTRGRGGAPPSSARRRLSPRPSTSRTAATSSPETP